MATSGTTGVSEARPSVGIVGAGMAGLTAALRLAERGFKVTVYEQNRFLGGLLSAHTHDGAVYHEHCYHMFLNWYHNFWDLVDDVGLSRERDFTPLQTLRLMQRGAHGDDAPQVFTLYSPGALDRVADNLWSGVAPPADVFLAGYSMIDLLTQQFRPGRLLDEYSVNSFMQSRPYASEQSAALHDHTLAKAFAVPSYLTSAASYKNFLKYSLREPDPLLWVLRGDAEQALQRPLAERLRELGCEVKLGCRVTAVDPKAKPEGDTQPVSVKWVPADAYRKGECYVAAAGQEGATKVPELVDERAIVRAPWTRPNDEAPGTGWHDYAILAVPPGALQGLIAPQSLAKRAAITEVLLPLDARPSRIQASPAAHAALRWPRLLKLKSEPMAALDLYFKRRLAEIPREHVVLLGSEFGLTFIDNSQTWGGDGNTVLNVIASDFKAIANLEPRDAVYAILEELTAFIPFDESDVDWSKLHFQTNVGDKLFINEVGSEAYRPGPTTDSPNLFLAGDFCKTPIDVVTVEAAVVSGLQAARALQVQALYDRRFAFDDPQARSIGIVEPEAFPDAQLVLLKLLLAPHAYVAKAWSWLHEQSVGPADPPDPSDVLAVWSRALFAPYAATATWWRTVWDLWLDAAGLARYR